MFETNVENLPRVIPHMNKGMMKLMILLSLVNYVTQNQLAICPIDTLHCM